MRGKEARAEKTRKEEETEPRRGKWLTGDRVSRGNHREREGSKRRGHEVKG